MKTIILIALCAFTLAACDNTSYAQQGAQAFFRACKWNTTSYSTVQDGTTQTFTATCKRVL